MVAPPATNPNRVVRIAFKQYSIPTGRNRLKFQIFVIGIQPGMRLSKPKENYWLEIRKQGKRIIPHG